MDNRENSCAAFSPLFLIASFDKKTKTKTKTGFFTVFLRSCPQVFYCNSNIYVIFFIFCRLFSSISSQENGGDFPFRTARTPQGGGGLPSPGHSTNGVSSNGTGDRSKPPEKPERRVNVQDSINKHKNWFSAFEKNRTGPESVDSARDPYSVSSGGGGRRKNPLGSLLSFKLALAHSKPLSGLIS